MLETTAKDVKILILEDEPFLALDMELVFRSAGYTVVGPASSVAEAEHLIEAENPDLASLDYNLKGETSAPVARLLAGKGKGFVFVTGRPLDLLLDDGVPAAPTLSKPISPQMVLSTLTANLSPLHPA